MRQRSGITLIEVIMAIFVMAIGMIALLTLFPAKYITIGARTAAPTTPGILRYVGWGSAVFATDLYWFSLLDDMNFDTNGLPRVPAGGTAIERETQYTWAYMLRRPKASDVELVDM